MDIRNAVLIRKCIPVIRYLDVRGGPQLSSFSLMMIPIISGGGGWKMMTNIITLKWKHFSHGFSSNYNTNFCFFCVCCEFLRYWKFCFFIFQFWRRCSSTDQPGIRWSATTTAWVFRQFRSTLRTEWHGWWWRVRTDSYSD